MECYLCRINLLDCLITWRDDFEQHGSSVTLMIVKNAEFFMFIEDNACCLGSACGFIRTRDLY